MPSSVHAWWEDACALWLHYSTILVWAVGGGSEAMANDAHGVNVRKIRGDPFCQKKREKKRSDVELWREFTYDSNGLSTYGAVYTMATI